MLYNSFKNVDRIPEDEVAESKIKYNMFSFLGDKYKLITFDEDAPDWVFVLTDNGRALIEAINGRLKTLSYKKSGSDLFPELKGLGVIDEAVLDQLILLYEKAQIETKGNDVIYLDKISKELADNIYKATGKKVEGFKHVVTFSNARHIYKNHGGDFEKLSNQKPVTEIEFANFPYVVNAFDTINIGNSENTIVFEKKIGNYYFVVEEVLEAQKTLRLKKQCILK
jgi:hypothetical protein